MRVRSTCLGRTSTCSSTLGIGTGGASIRTSDLSHAYVEELGLFIMSAAPDSTAFRRARLLAESLPALQELHGRTVVVKYGGNAMVDDALKAAFADDMVLLRARGIHPSSCMAAVRRSGDAEARRLGRRVPRRVPCHHPG